LLGWASAAHARFGSNAGISVASGVKKSAGIVVAYSITKRSSGEVDSK
jgi:hypothetical protein